jgi:hypothetical protein
MGEMKKEGKKNLINMLMTSSLETKGTKKTFPESLCCGADVSNLAKICTKISLLYVLAAGN